MDVEGTHVHDSERLSKRPWMDASLCERFRLPEHLGEKILSRLPIRDIFRVRAVCHMLNSLVSSPGFGLVRAREGVPSEGPWFFRLAMTEHADVNEVDRIAAYYPSENKWHWIRHMATTDTMLGRFQYHFVSSDGGLICYYDCYDRIVIVVNPLTKAYRRLPKGPEDIAVDSICLVVDQETRSYQVFLIGRCADGPGTFNVVLEAYHSSSDCWYRMGSKLPLRINGMVSPAQALHASGCLHMFSKQSSELLVFSLDEHVWRRIKVPFLRFLYDVYVLWWQESLLIIGDKQDINDNVPRMWQPVTDSICIWELHRASSSWVLVDRMPDHLFREFSYRDEGQQVELVVTSVADCSLVLLVVARYNRDGSPVTSGTTFKTVLYDLEKQVWTMVESCLSHGIGLSDGLGYFETVVYEPRLDAMV